MWFQLTQRDRNPISAAILDISDDITHLEFEADKSCSVQFLIDQRQICIENTAPFTVDIPTNNTNRTVVANVYSEKRARGKLIQTAALTLRSNSLPDSRPDPRDSRPDPRDSRPDSRDSRPDPRDSRPDPKIIYRETFADAVANMLQKNKYWVFAWTIKSQPPYGNLSPRFVKLPDRGGLRVTCLAGDGDYSGLGLNPRAELRVEGYRLPVGVDLYAKIHMRACQAKSGFEFFQIMSTGGGSFPVLQLEIRKGNFGVRQNTFKALVPRPLFAEHQREINWEVQFRLVASSSDNRADGYFKVFADGKLVWSYTGKTVYDGANDAWTQYGVYRNAGTSQDQSIEVYHFELGKM